MLYQRSNIKLRNISSRAKQSLSEFAEILKNDDNKIILDCICKRCTNQDIIVNKIDKYEIETDYLLCRNCGTIRISPYFKEDVINFFYSNIYRTIKDTPIEKLFQIQVKQGAVIDKFLSNSIKIEKIEKIIEIGCGAGGILKHFQDQYGIKVIGYDFNNEFIDYGKSNMLDLRIGNIFDDYFTRQDNAIIVINHVLEHIVDPVGFIDKLESIIGGNTYVYIAVPGIIGYPSRYYKNNFWKYFTFVHPWNYTLNSLKSNLLNNRKFEILCETNEIAILLTRSAKKLNCKNKKTEWIKVFLFLHYFRKRESIFYLLHSLYRKFRHIFI